MRIINQIEYNDVTIFDEFIEKFSLSLKQILMIHFREFEFFATINIEFQRIWNKLNIIKKNKIKIKILRFDFIYFKITFIETCYEHVWKISIEDLILSARVHIETSENLTHISTFDIRSSCRYLLSKSNILVMLSVF